MITRARAEDGLDRQTLLEALAPTFDATRVELRIVDGEADAAFDAVRGADFLRAWRGNPAVKALFALRGAAEAAASVALGRELPRVEPPESMRLADMPAAGEWVILGEAPPNEIAFGAVGRFWGGETAWTRIEAAEFREFDRPGFAKLVCNFSLRPYDRDHTLVSYEARTVCTDHDSSRAFLRYWKVVSPFVGVVMRSMLDIIDEDARAAAEAHV